MYPELWKNFGDENSDRCVKFVLHSKDLCHTELFRKFSCGPGFISREMLLGGVLKTVGCQKTRGSKLLAWKNKYMLDSSTIVRWGARLLSVALIAIERHTYVTLSAFILWEVVTSTLQWEGLLSASGLQPLGCALIKMALCGVLFISTLLL